MRSKNKEFEVLTRAPIPPDLDPRENVWDLLDKPDRSKEALKDLLLTAPHSGV